MSLLRRDTDRRSVEHRPTLGRNALAAARPGIGARETLQRDPQPIERLLFIADAAVAGADELPPQVRAIIDAAAEVYVVTPTLPGRLAWLADDVDRFRHSADERLDTILGQMRSIRARARRAPRGGAMTVSQPYQDPSCRRRTCDWLVAVRGTDTAAIHRFPSREDADAFAAARGDNAAMPRKPRELNAEQRTALAAARRAQRRFERAQAGLEQASDDRARAFTAALDAGITYGELAKEFDVPRGSIQAAAAGRARKR